MPSRNILWRIVLISLLFYSVFSFLSVSLNLTETRQRAQSMAQQLEALRVEHSRLAAALEQGSDSRLQDMARQRLGLVLPGEKIFYFTEDRED